MRPAAQRTSAGSTISHSLQGSLRSSHIRYYEDCGLQSVTTKPGKDAEACTDSSNASSVMLVIRSGREESSAYKCAHPCYFISFLPL